MKRCKTLTWGFGLALLVALPLVVSARTERLPIGAFLDAQPLWYWNGWHDPATHRVLDFDVFGKSAEGWKLPPPTFEGSVTVRELADGHAHVSVRLLTKNALCFGYQNDENEQNPAAAFGYTTKLVAEGYTSSLGDGLLRVEFLMPKPDSPLPNYFDLFKHDPKYPLLSVSAVVNCTGELRDGSGYPDGTPGMAHTTQVGLFATGVPRGYPPEQDGNYYPSERIEWWPTGPR